MDADAVAQAIVDVAARLILPRFGRLRPDEVDAKKPGDLVTVADTEAEAALTAILQADDPRALIVGEEASFADPSLVDALPEADHAWVVDPVDGTNNFAQGDPRFGVLVAELRGGETVRGWIWQPVAGRMFVAELGAGVRCNGEELGRLSAAEPARGRVPGRLRRMPPPGFDLRPTSRSCAVDYPLLLTGETDLLGFTHHHPRDHAAGVLMLNELGGYAAMHGGGPWRPGDSGRLLFLAASEDLWRRADAALVTDAILGL